MIIVAGFEPFRGEKVNPSMLIAGEVDGRTIVGEEVRGVILPVSYRKVKPLVESLVREEPRVLLLLGLAPRATCVRLEAIALNVAHSERGDEEGFKPFNQPVYEDGELAYRGTIPFNRILESLRRAGIPSALSFHAGTFLCNYAYYVALHNAHGTRTRVGFIHIPHLTEYAVRKPEFPSLPRELVVRAVEIVLEETLRSEELCL
ncbi:MAG: pyroglutamyl-peptidase I [Thermoprotei archaeon]|nr:MAG: pyroglutamyl-peptidase I [Thermoprotei archaeon]